MVEREIVKSTGMADFVLLIEISSIESTKTPGFVLEAPFSSDGSTKMADFVLSLGCVVLFSAGRSDDRLVDDSTSIYFRLAAQSERSSP